jgi:hypothetical protein
MIGPTSSGPMNDEMEKPTDSSPKLVARAAGPPNSPPSF